MFPSLGPSLGLSLAAPHALLGRELAGALAAPFIPAPSLGCCLQLRRPIPNSVLSSSFVAPSLPPCFTALFRRVLPLLFLNLGSTFLIIFLLP